MVGISEETPCLEPLCNVSHLYGVQRRYDLKLTIGQCREGWRQISCLHKEMVIRCLQISFVNENFLDMVHYVDRGNRLGFKTLGPEPDIGPEKLATELAILKLFGSLYLVLNQLSGPVVCLLVIS